MGIICNCMIKRIILFLFSVVFGATCLYAQDVLLDSENKQTAVATNEASSTSKQRLSRGKKQKILEDSLLILNDSIVKLNATIEEYKKSEQIKGQVNNSQLKIDSLYKEIHLRDSILSNQIVVHFGQHLSNAPDFFCRAVMESPLYYKFDPEAVKLSKDLSKAMGYDNKMNKWNFVYNVYKDLLENYSVFNEELINITTIIIEQFSAGKPNREFERERFEDRLLSSKYYKIRGKGENGKYRHIFYLDYRIEQIRDLFKTDANFRKTKFVEIRDALK